MTLDSIDTTDTHTTTEGTTTMTMTEDRTTTTDDVRGMVAELRYLCPDTAETRRMWARFDAVAGVRWLDDDVLATYSANKGKRRRYDQDRPQLTLGMRHGDGSVWWTDSYRLHREGSERGWEVPACRGDEGGVLALDEWLSGPELAEVVRSGGPTVVAPTRAALLAVCDLLPASSKAAYTLGKLAVACDGATPRFGELVAGAEAATPQVWMHPTRMIPNAPRDMAVLESADGGVVSAVDLAYLAAFRPDVTWWAVDATKPLRAVVDGTTVGLLMPIRNNAGPLAGCDQDRLLLDAVRDMKAARLWAGKKMLAADARLFELLRLLDVMVPA